MEQGGKEEECWERNPIFRPVMNIPKPKLNMTARSCLTRMRSVVVTDNIGETIISEDTKNGRKRLGDALVGWMALKNICRRK